MHVLFHELTIMITQIKANTELISNYDPMIIITNPMLWHSRHHSKIHNKMYITKSQGKNTGIKQPASMERNERNIEMVEGRTFTQKYKS